METEPQSETLSAIMTTVRMKPSELESVRNAALQAGLSFSEYVRAKLCANPALIPSQSSATNPLIPSQELPSSASPKTSSSLLQSLPASEQEGIAGHNRIHSIERKRAKPGECEHGFKKIGRLTACSECKKTRA